jgi:hypothetical protein
MAHEIKDPGYRCVRLQEYKNCSQERCHELPDASKLLEPNLKAPGIRYFASFILFLKPPCLQRIHVIYWRYGTLPLRWAVLEGWKQHNKIEWL